MSFQYLNSVETQLMSIDVIIESLGQVATARLLITHICTPRRGGGMGSRHGRFFFLSNTLSRPNEVGLLCRLRDGEPMTRPNTLCPAISKHPQEEETRFLHE